MDLCQETSGKSREKLDVDGEGTITLFEESEVSEVQKTLRREVRRDGDSD